ncbi:Putative chromatin-remodelling complex, RSC SWI/SNF subunit Rsc7/Swp82 [Septoria linicola]|uniref:Chromatin-remodelling complex, RSC SWI/SNF subunit Rsc7/Swp82 n=1 Tax=Septoria linicola TaxID=215465 RepID=A0A9Q9AUJ3_9PEZI|nr:putative chromatin-remodelling complex, RSC SWI/SNF subunit Rsc7/Swp82 [Septoria linicola]USW55074.1 Putative chromatin-remodelling complex, RSC SWI/SNF subunit Rsc7/Swp82 [Septoria linicola]
MPFKKGGGHHKGRKGNARISLTATRTPTPRVDDDNEDEEMADQDEIQYEAPQADGEDDEAEDAATPAAEEDDDDDDDEPRITTIPRRRARGGRRVSRRGGDGDTPEPGDDGSEGGTPYRRRRGRPSGFGGNTRGRGGFRGRRRGQKDDGPKTVTDKNGNVLEVIDDEAQVDWDPEGDEKVDALGNLQGGREYRVRTFTIMGKGERQYMLSTEPARCCGFRDSYLFFTKHPKLYKVVVGEEEKKDLIERGILPSSYKGRNIGVVSARSVFREFGSKIVVGGRRVTDDYRAADARAEGAVEGELADPDDHVPDKREEYNRNRYVAWFGASDVYKTGGSTVPNKQGPIGKRRNNITVQNWQYMHAREATRFNTLLTMSRTQNLNGVYDFNTNTMFFPKIMQPTHAKWEYIQPGEDSPEDIPMENGLTNGHTNGEDVSMKETTKEETIFTKVPPVISRNFKVIDTVYKAPPISHAGYPGPDGHVEDPTSGPNGLSTVSQELIDELPPDCRVAFEAARATELQWKRQWGTEASSAQRGHLKIGFNGYPV